MSDFHPESWNPLWSVGTILSVSSHAYTPRQIHALTNALALRPLDAAYQGLQSFMTEDSDAVGSVRSSNAQRTALAVDSLNFNMRDKSGLLTLFATHFC